MGAPEFEPARPLPPAGGLTAGEHAQTWWSRRFLELLESFGVGSRLERGRDYARGGQVTELEVEPGIALAKVQGTRYTPYRVRIRAKLLSEHQWRRAERAMAARALPLAQLLAGRMPPDIEDVLAGCKLSLFPTSYTDLKASCDCPDAENPCKHIAAVYYLLAERFDAEPFLIFTWRGRTQEELLDGLRARRARSKTKRSSASPRTAAAGAEGTRSFWQSGPELADLRISPLAGEAPDALLRRLGPAPVEADGRDLADALAAMYAHLAEAAERRALSG
ncbi:MAG: SWIM zinc finger family protein [Thermoleophilaceae bacterium]